MEKKTVTISSTFPFTTEANSNFGKGRGTFPFTDKKKLSSATGWFTYFQFETSNTHKTPAIHV